MPITLLMLIVLAMPYTALAQRTTPLPPVDRTIAALPLDTVVAVVDGEKITLAEVDAFSRAQDPARLFQLNQQLYELRQRTLDAMVGERLLNHAASRAGISVTDLIARLPVEPVDDRDVDAMLADVQQRGAPVAPDSLRPLIVQFLRDRKRDEARSRYIQELLREHRRGAKPAVRGLEPPRVHVAVEPDDPVQGDGAVQVVEFSDFECPFCRKAQPALREVLKRYRGKVQLVWKDFPLPMHANAVDAAAAARCAHEQGRFWAYHDVLFDNQQALGSADLRKHAQAAGIDARAFDECVTSGRHRVAVADAARTSTYPVDATPTFFINGRLLTGAVPFEQLAAVIDQEIAN